MNEKNKDDGVYGQKDNHAAAHRENEEKDEIYGYDNGFGCQLRLSCTPSPSTAGDARKIPGQSAVLGF